MKMTVAVIAMNHEKYIEQACRTIIGQTYRDFEIVFLDNNSSDKTFEIGDAIFRESGIPYKGIKSTVGRNVSSNFNILVENSKGEYISFLSGDDWYTPDALEKKLEYITKYNFDLLFSDGYKYIQDTDETLELYPGDHKKRVLNLDNYFWEAILDNYLFSVGMTAKRQVLVDNPFEEKVWMEDWEICLRLSLLGYKLGFIDDKLFYYRILSTSLSNNSKVMREDYFTIVNKFYGELEKRPKLLKKFKLRRYSSNIAKLEAQGEMTAADKKNYIQNKKDYARVKYSFPKREAIIAYWAAREMFA
ncbi:MAG: glycosyltransferase family 2 protein [Flavobacterium sp.]